MALDDYEPLTDGALERMHVCIADGCEARGVVDDPYRGKVSPLCFRHAVIAALDERDEEMCSLALGWAVAEGIKTSRGVQA